MKIFQLLILWQLATTTCISSGGPSESAACNEHSANQNCNKSTTATTRPTTHGTSADTDQTTGNKNSDTTTDPTTKAESTMFTFLTVNMTTTNNTATTASDASSQSRTTIREAPKSDSGSNTTVIVVASVGTCVAIIFFVFLFLIRRQHILKNCRLPQKQQDEKKLTSINNNMYPDIEGTSDDNKYAEIPLDSLDSIKNDDNVYQTIDPLEEQETEIDDKYSHISGNALPLTNTSYSHISGDFQNKRVVEDYNHIGKLEGNPERDLKFKAIAADTSYDIIGKAKFGMTENPKVMEPTYNHTHNETNQTGTSKSDGDNYCHLHVLTTTITNNETKMNIGSDEPVGGFRLMGGTDEPKTIDKTKETGPAAVVKLPEESNFALTENCEENAVDHQYFVLEKVDLAEENEPPAVVKLPEASKFSLTETDEENAVDHKYFVLEKVDK